ncbi:hypothetical protein ACFL06_00360 [Patescibacteria group bacterium]
MIRNKERMRKNTIYDIRALGAILFGILIMWAGTFLIDIGSPKSIGAFVIIVFGFFFAIFGFLSHGFRPEMWSWKLWKRTPGKEEYTWFLYYMWACLFVKKEE